MKVTWGPEFGALTPIRSMRGNVDKLQKQISKLPQYELETYHFFHSGLYCRKVIHPKDVLVVGKVHKKEHLFVVASGRIVVTDGDNYPIEYKSGDVLCSMPGVKRASVALEDSIIMTFHITSAITVEDAEIELIQDDPDSMMTIGNKIKKEYLSCHL